MKGELNEVTAKVTRARKLKTQMEKLFSVKFRTTKEDNSKLKAELEQIKAKRREVKRQFKECQGKFDEVLGQQNQLQEDINLLSSAIQFKQSEIDKVGEPNAKRFEETEGINGEIADMRKEFDELARELAEAAEALKIVETRVAINNNDPRCQMTDLPAELAQLLDSLNAVTTKLEPEASPPSA
jgi:chromosome segregation ATPase